VNPPDDRAPATRRPGPAEDTGTVTDPAHGELVISPDAGQTLAVPGGDVPEFVDGLPLTAAEAGYIAASRAPNTLRGYRNDWKEFTTWCAHTGRDPLPAAPDTISTYLVALADANAKVGTISRRLSSIRFAHATRDLPDPTSTARVTAVWEGIRRTHGAPPEQSAPLMPPQLLEVLDACPRTRTWKTRPDEPDLAGLRDRALLLVGFWSALRRAELAALTVDQVAEHPGGRVLTVPRSKTNQHGEVAELAVLPYAADPALCPVTALTTWTDAAAITDGPLLRPVSTGNRALARRLNPESLNTLVQAAVARAGIDPTPYSAHSLRAGFVTYAHLNGATDRDIAHQTRHRSLSTIDTYIRVERAWHNNAATQLGL
jgi:site-specific recombinase XerD